MKDIVMNVNFSSEISNKSDLSLFFRVSSAPTSLPFFSVSAMTCITVSEKPPQQSGRGRGP